MNLSGRGSFRKKDSLMSTFTNSCLGRIIITVIAIIVVMVIAFFTNPTEETMFAETNDNIRQCIEENDSLTIDGLDAMLNNIGYMFSEADTTKTTDVMDEFNKYNRMEYYDHVVFSTIRLSNNYRIEGVRCAIGIFGMVIPTANYSDFLLRVGPVRKDYNQPIIPQTGDEEYFGENPDLGGVFRYEGE
jgi:hypothetical protein